MSVSILSNSKQKITLKIEINFEKTMLESEESILKALNEAGTLATAESLKQFDTNGSPIQIGELKATSKGLLSKIYQTPYGEAEIKRHVYQTNLGGKTFCPLEQDARIIITSTPRFAKIISHKFATVGSTQVETDLLENHGRKVARSFLQNVSSAIGVIAQAKEESWHYRIPKLDKAVKTIGIGLDGTCMLLCGEGYREAMVGTISLYDKVGERQHTIYIGAAPEYGKSSFLERLRQEIEHVKKLYPKATYIGIADGAKENWPFLKEHTEKQILDFYHATKYLGDLASVEYPRNKKKREEWLEEHCHLLKHEKGEANRVIKEMKVLEKQELSETGKAKLKNAKTYFKNNKELMNYSEHVDLKLPIGSGVTEAACKTLVKQRLCLSGMKWKEKGASIVLSLRSLVLTEGRWNEFWSKLDKYGFPVAA